MATQDERFVEAQELLGNEDYEKAIPLFEALAKEGYASAQYTLGVLYLNGEGVPKDNAKAVEWTRKAADQGDADAEYNLGAMYQNGDGVQRDLEKASEWYIKAADHGSDDAQNMLRMLKAQVQKMLSVADDMGVDPNSPDIQKLQRTLNGLEAH